MDQQYNQANQKEEQCIEDFQNLIKSTETYIDKTLFIKQVINTKERIIIVHRPPKWGKSINMSMLSYYFGCNVIQGFTKIEQSVFNNELQFKKFKISQCEFSQQTILQKASHPIIFLNFKDIECANMLQFAEMIRNQLQQYAKKQLKDINTIEYTDQHTLNQYIYNLITQVAKELQQQHNKRDCLLLIDNYSFPTELMMLNKINGFEIQKCVNFLQTMCKHFVQSYDLKTKKDNNRKVILAGKMNIWDQTNCIKVQQKFCSLKDSYYSDCFGFDENEIREYLLNNINLDKQAVFQNLKKWHNGFVLVKKNKKSADDIKLIFHPYTSKRYIEKCIEQNKIVAGSLLLSYNTYDKLISYIKHNYMSNLNQILGLVKKIQSLNTQCQNFSMFRCLYNKKQYKILNYAIKGQKNKNYIQQQIMQEEVLMYLLYYNGILTGRVGDHFFYIYIPNRSFLALLQQLLKENLKIQTSRNFSYIDIQDLENVRQNFKTAINNWDWIGSLSQFRFNAMTLIRYGLSDNPTHRVFVQQKVKKQNQDNTQIIQIQQHQQQMKYQIKTQTGNIKTKQNVIGILDDCYYPCSSTNKQSFIVHSYKLERDLNPTEGSLINSSQIIFWQIFSNKYFKRYQDNQIAYHPKIKIKNVILRSFIFYRKSDTNTEQQKNKHQKHFWQVHAKEIYLSCAQAESLEYFFNNTTIKVKMKEIKGDYKKIHNQLLEFTGSPNVKQFIKLIKSKSKWERIIIKRRKDQNTTNKLSQMSIEDGDITILKKGLSPLMISHLDDLNDWLKQQRQKQQKIKRSMAYKQMVIAKSLQKKKM